MKILINKETRKILKTGNKVYKAPESGAGLPIELASQEVMEAALIEENIGKIYKFVGETNEMFTNGSYYEVIDDGKGNEPTFEVKDVEGASYRFIENNGYYISNNHGIGASAALCKVVVNNPGLDNEYKMIVECTQLTEDNYDFGLLSHWDTALSLDAETYYGGSDDINNGLVYFSLPNDFETNRVEYELPSGEHYITVKYSKDGSAEDQNDEFKFRVYFERVEEEPDQPSEPEPTLKTFTITTPSGVSREFSFEEGMRWSDFIESEYNIDGLIGPGLDYNFECVAINGYLILDEYFECMMLSRYISAMEYHVEAEVFDEPDQPEQPSEPGLSAFFVTDGVDFRGFNFEQGMTWRMFIDSSYNINGLFGSSGFSVTINNSILYDNFNNVNELSLEDVIYTNEANMDSAYYTSGSIRDQPAEEDQPYFKLRDVSYTFEEGMTWSDFINSNYNSENRFSFDTEGRVVFAYDVTDSTKMGVVYEPAGSECFYGHNTIYQYDFIPLDYRVTCSVCGNENANSDPCSSCVCPWCGTPLENGECPNCKCPDCGTFVAFGGLCQNCEQEQPSEPTQPTEGTAGYYLDATGEFIPWATLIENGNITVSDGAITGQELGALGSGKLVVDNSITNISPEAFSYCNSLTSIVIPNSVTSIGYATFSGCSALTKVVLPESITSLDDCVFSGCTSLVDITIPNNVSSIVYAFDGCSSLESIVIPENVTWISTCAFRGCTNLTIYSMTSSSKSSEWDIDWNPDNRPVYWAGEWHYDENGNPTPGAPEEPGTEDEEILLSFELYSSMGEPIGVFNFEEGMTWGEFINSEYNVDGNFRLDGAGISVEYDLASACYVYVDEMCTVSPENSDPIIANRTYYIF